MIQYVMETLMKSEDKHAKIFMLLCMLTINNSLQTQLACQYPVDGNEVNRLKPFLDKVKVRGDFIFLPDVIFLSSFRPPDSHAGHIQHGLCQRSRAESLQCRGAHVSLPVSLYHRVPRLTHAQVPSPQGRKKN